LAAILESLGKKSPAHSSTTHFSATAMIAAVSVGCVSTQARMRATSYSSGLSTIVDDGDPPGLSPLPVHARMRLQLCDATLRELLVILEGLVFICVPLYFRFRPNKTND
jgi:hypothetical protein